MFVFLLLGTAAVVAAWYWGIRPRGGVRFIDASLRRTIQRTLAAVPESGASLADLQRHIDRGVRAAVVVTSGGEGHVPPLLQVEANDEDHELLRQYWETVVGEQRKSLARDQHLVVPARFRMVLEQAEDAVPGRPRVMVPGGSLTQPYWENPEYLRPSDARGGETVPVTASTAGPEGARATRQYARLENGRRAPLLLTSDNTIGRSSQATIKVEDPSVSKVHARLSWTDSGWAIQDLSSLNGVYVDGRRIAVKVPVFLDDGQRIGLGLSTEFHFREGPPSPGPQA